MHRHLRKFFDLQLAIAMLAIIVMMVVVVVDVAMRFAFNAPVRGSYDLVEIALMISVFYCIGPVIFLGQEITIDLIDTMVPRPFLIALKLVAALLALAVLVFIFWSMLRPTFNAVQYGEVKLELDLPIWTIWCVALVGLGGGVLGAVAALVDCIRGATNPNRVGVE